MSCKFQTIETQTKSYINFYQYKDVCSPLKIIALITSIALIAIAITFHFKNINNIVVFTLIGISSSLILSLVIYTLVKKNQNSNNIKSKDFLTSNELVKPNNLIQKPFKFNYLNTNSQKKFAAGMQNFKANTSYVYVDVPFKDREGKIQAPDWYTLSYLSYIGKFSEDPEESTQLQKNAENEHGPFLFALSFSNCHSTIKIDEPEIYMPDPMPDNLGNVTCFPNVECYFQYYKCALFVESLANPKKQKKACTKFRKQISDNKFLDPNAAFTIGHRIDLNAKTLAAWEKIKVEVMQAALFAKFSQNHHLGEMLKMTAPFPLVQLKTDEIWGPGKDGKGKNLLGVCLMEIRKALIENQSVSLSIKEKKFNVPIQKPN